MTTKPRKGGKRRPSRSAAQSSAPTSVQVRIIGGAFRRRRLQVPAVAGLRPTPDRVRETLFNWLAGDIEGATCLDLFAGSGALALEAASRGAARVVALERDPTLAHSIAEHCAALGANTVEVVNADAWQWLRGCRERFDIVFLDPPFREAALARALESFADGRLLLDAALIYVESERENPLPELPTKWEMLRCAKAGQVRYHLLRSGAPPAPAEHHGA